MLDLPSFHQAKVVVVGDVMLDRYWSGATERISPEAPVPVVKVNNEKYLPGGAANVALNLAALGVEVELFGLIGNDEAGKILSDCLQTAGVKCSLQIIEDYPTITKLRVIGQSQQLIRVDFEKIFLQQHADTLLTDYAKALETADAVILSDYKKGVLASAQCFIEPAKKRDIPIAVDPKASTFSIYKGATILTPNLKEMQAVVGDCEDDSVLFAKARAEIINNDLQALLITRSEKGMVLVSRDAESVVIPTRAQSVFDVTGAGDTVISVLAAALGLHSSFEKAARLANIAASISIAKLGAATVSVAELHRALRRIAGAATGIVSVDELQLLLQDCRAQNEKIVFTNGCFDVLHSGHIQYLEQAKKCGARLIVAVNDDDSVRRLKGESRPVNSLNERMSVLAGLRAVDWVVPFSEDTPLQLIQCLKPDVLVKGGDYSIETVVGSDFVMANGGEVKILSFKDGVSTTRLIEKIESRSTV